MSRRQLRRLGFSDREIEGLVRSGVLIRVHHGVYAVGHARLSIRGRWMAAVLACGEGACLSHRDASALFGLERVAAGAIHVTARGAHRVTGVRCHTARDMPDTVRIDGIPVTTVERTALDLAADLSPQRLRSLLEQVQRQDRFDLRRFDALVQRSNGHRGVGPLRAALAELSDEPPRLRSGLERDALELIRDAGLPEPATNTAPTGETVDVRWPRYRVTVEIDSYRYHRGRRRFGEDRRRGNVVALSGDVLLRYTDDQLVADPGAVTAQIAGALRAAGWPG